ncbi:g4264 [Coccomyxa elongata]
MAQGNIIGRPHVGPNPAEVTFETKNKDCMTSSRVRDEGTRGVLWWIANGLELVYWLCSKCMDAFAEVWDDDWYGHNPSEAITLMTEALEGSDLFSFVPKTSTK